MTDATANSLMNETPSNGWMDWLDHSMTRVVFLAFMVWVIFFPEHNFDVVLAENFVQDIEDQEKWSSGGNLNRRFAFLSAAVVGVISLLLGRGQRFRINLPVVLIATYVLWAGAVGTEVFFGKFVPYRGSYRFAGPVHPNIQAATLAMGCLAAFTMTRIKPKFSSVFFGIFGVLFLFLVLTKCRSATLCVPVCIGMMWLTAQSTQKILIGTFLAFWAIGTVVLLVQITGFDPIAEFEEILLLGRKEETGESLTGRLPLWEDLSTYIARKPVQGFGYGAFWTPRHINEIAGSQEWVISEAHSSYFDTMLQLGIVGCFLMALTAVTTFFYSAITFRRTLKPEYLFLVGGVFFCLVRGFTESGLSGPSGGTSFMFLAIAAHSGVPNQKLIDTNTDANNDKISIPSTPNPPSIS